MPLGMEVGLGLGDFVLDGDPVAPCPERGAEPPPRFLAHFYCGQMAACIKKPLGMVSPGDFGNPAPPKFLAHVYYSYCDFVRTLHNAQSL